MGLLKSINNFISKKMLNFFDDWDFDNKMSIPFGHFFRISNKSLKNSKYNCDLYDLFKDPVRGSTIMNGMTYYLAGAVISFQDICKEAKEDNFTHQDKKEIFVDIYTKCLGFIYKDGDVNSLLNTITFNYVSLKDSKEDHDILMVKMFEYGKQHYFDYMIEGGKKLYDYKAQNFVNVIDELIIYINKKNFN